jgi:PAS domain S-box-containing protein
MKTAWSFLATATLAGTLLCSAAACRSPQHAEDGGEPPLPRIELTTEERAWLRDHPVISVAQDPGWPPVEFADTRGEPSGISNDYLKAVEQELGVTFLRVTGLSWQDSYARLRVWDLDMTTCVASTPERDQFWAFTKPYIRIPIVILTRADVTYIHALRELAGKKVALVDGYIAAELIPRDVPQIELVKVRRVEDGLELLRRGEVFALVDSMLVISYLLAEHRAGDLKIAGETPYVNAQSMAVRKDWAVLAGILDKALDAIPESRRMGIYNRWVPVRYEHGFDYRLLWQALAVFGVILAALLLWIQRLRREIHKRRVVEAALAKSESLLRQAQEVSGVGGWELDLQSRRFTWTEETARIHGVPPGQGPQDVETVLAFYAPEDRSRVGEAVRGAMERGEPYDLEARMVSGAGRTIWVRSVGRAERDGRGVTRVYGSLMDITARKALEARYLQAQKMDVIGRLAGGIAHDFNNMLQVIASYTELAIAKTPEGPPVRGHLLEIRKAAARSAALTRQLLAFARKQVAAPRPVALNETVEGMLGMLRQLIGEDIALSWRPGPGLWRVKIDPAQLDQVLANLAVNARDAIRGSGTLTVSTANVALDDSFCVLHGECLPGEYVLLTVSDTGCGMTEETLSHVFEPFFTTKDVGKGTGLGTATVYGIITQNNGFTDVSSAPGAGTTFRIYLPRYAEAAPAEGRAPGAQALPPPGTETILLVEDEPAILSLGREMLESLGYTVLLAERPGRALRVAAEHRGEIHLLITDVVMPEMSGSELEERIRALRPGARCLLISGYAADVLARRGLEENGIRLLHKPFTLEQLARAVRESLAQRSGGGTDPSAIPFL